MFGRDEKPSQIRLTVVQYLILAVFLVLAYGLWRLQVSQSDYYSAAAEQNRIRNVPILAPRGRIVDRNGRIIVDNYRSVTALLMRDSSRDLMTDSDEIASGLHMDPKEVKEKIRRFAFTPQYQPIYLKEDITPDEEAFIEAHKLELPELDTIMAYRRLYPLKGFMAHVIGYVGEVSEDMLNQPQFELYNPGDVVGKSGVELEYNGILMGKNGSRQVLVDSHGREVGKPLEEKAAEPGKQLKLTVDVDLQIAAEEALADKNGAVVAMDPHTGEILAMVSRPTFDPNAFAVRISSKEWSKLVNDPDKPLLNRAIQAQLAPGSTFKIIMSVAGWQEGVAQDLNVQCNGGAEFYGRRFGCWVKGGHGPVDLTKAIYQSCDVFFYNLANKLGINRIAQYATSFGLGQRTGIDLPQEVSGVIPSEEWKLRNFRQKWFAGETISVGIGQGAVAVSPIQLTRAIAAISMDGRLVTPHVADPAGLPSNYLEVNHYTEVKNVPVDMNGWNLITDAMSRVLLPEGTAPSAHIPGIDIAGKTGSAQVVSLATRAKHQNNEDLAQNGWFVGFTPRRNPDIVVGVLFQGGEHGKLAARLATEVIKSYVDKQRRQPTGLANGKPSTDGNAEIGALWTSPNERGPGETLEVGHLAVALPKKPRPVATSAPGLE
ncbi:MAG TPA: penicillin-binding protein 2 [Terriglobales bacterium]|jgi:penicillin-binding protein 2|nr:penicillin-binding protein 2 [Terriglobales bacterium]